MTTAVDDEGVTAFGATLIRRWVAFGRLLRRNGVEVTPGQVRDLLRVLPLLNLRDRESVYYAARATLCSSKSDLPRFDLAFRQFSAGNCSIPAETRSQPRPDPPRPSACNPRKTTAAPRPAHLPRR